MALNLREKGGRWCCSVRGSHTEVELRKGTWLANPDLLFRKVVLFTFRVSKELTSIEFCKKELGVNKNTVFDWNNYIHEICDADFLANLVVAIGPSTTAEMDTSLFTLKNHKNECLVEFGGKHLESLMYIGSERATATLLPIIQGSIRPGTMIMLDLWVAYGGIKSWDIIILLSTIRMNSLIHSLELTQKTLRIHGKTPYLEIKSNMGHTGPYLIAIYVNVVIGN